MSASAGMNEYWSISLMNCEVRDGVERMRRLLPRCLRVTNSGMLGKIKLECQGSNHSSPFLPCLFWLS